MVWNLIKAFPYDEKMTRARKDAYDAAIAFLKDVSAGKVAIIAPDDAAAKQPAAPGITLTGSHSDNRRATRAKLAGL